MLENFSLKWNDFHSNITKSFSSLRKEQDFFDVTLVSDDQEQISAHKVVLSSCSEYFKQILKQNKHSHPLLCLEGIDSDQLNKVLDYIYNGEVNINRDDIDRFLNIAQRLKLEGLMEVENNLKVFDSEDDYDTKVDNESTNYHDDISDADSDEDKEVYFEAKNVLKQKPTSQCWNYFKFKGTKSKGANLKFVICMLCLESKDESNKRDPVFAYSSSTSNLNQHLLRHHKFH